MRNNTDINFTKGFILGAVVLSALCSVWHFVLLQAGEINLDRVIQRQSLNPNLLFSSGINQNVFSYKVKLMHKNQPKAIAVGSSRAMQFRQDFFKVRFLNMGGTVSNVADLEKLSSKLQLLNSKPELLMLLIDPWWFNPKHPTAKLAHLSFKYPDIISTDLILNATKAFKRGNWVSSMMDSDNLGIHAILTGDGFSADGSYHYTSTITSAKAASDVKFLNTLNRIEKSINRFEKADVADSVLIKRACIAAKKLKDLTNQLIVVAPPFSKQVWDEMEKGGYEYIQDAYSELENCMDIPVYDYSNPDILIGATDCEFIDGFHGGDTIYARILSTIANNKPALYQNLDMAFLDKFIDTFSGNAAGGTKLLIHGKIETDFLQLGCKKNRRDVTI